MGHKMRYRKCFTKTLAALLSTVLLFSTIGFSTMAEASGTEDIPGGSYVEEQNVNASFEENGPEQNSDPANTSNPTGTPDGGNSDSSGTPDGGPTETPGGGNSNPSGTLEGGNFVGDPKPGRTHDDSDNTPQRNANTVAVIGNEQFSSLEEAIDAVKEHQEGATTIQILKDTIIAKQINIERKKIILTADEARTITFSIATTDTNCFRVGNWSDTAASLTISGPLTITTTNESLRSIVNVTKKSFFSLRGGTLSSGNADLSHAIVCVDNGGSMTMSGGTIQGNPEHNSRGVMLQSTDTQPMSFNMTGGMIQNCFADENHHYGDGAGVYVGGSAQFIMSGESEIRNCTAEKFGGGVYLHKTTDETGTPAFYMRGGTISNCTAEKSGGGGIYTEKDNTFEMSGGTVTGNTAHAGGAGIFIRTTHAVISGGSITDNTSECNVSFGGGIYVEKDATLQLYNTVITDNSADVLGGGLWTCSTGDIKIYVTDGGAVYDNHAQAADGIRDSNQAGDDISNFMGENTLTLYAHMLGGGLNQYYRDGGVTLYLQNPKPDCDADRSFGTGAPATRSMRYGETFQKLYTDTVDKSTSVTLKNVVSDDDKTAAMKNAKEVITGNHASRGGGIGTNGNLIIGTPSGKDLLCHRGEKVGKYLEGGSGRSRRLPGNRRRRTWTSEAEQRKQLDGHFYRPDG